MVVTGTSTEKALHVGLVVLAVAAAIALLYYGRVFFITLVIATAISFLLEPMVRFFMRLRLPRALASFAVCSIALVFLYLAGLGIYLEVREIAGDIPAYSDRVNEVVATFAGRLQSFENGIVKTLMPKSLQTVAAAVPPDTRNKKKQEPPPPPLVQEVHIQQETVSPIPYVYGYFQQYFDVLLMASFVPFLVYFLLSWRDHLRSRWLLLFSGENRGTAADAWNGVGDMVRAFVVGNFLLGLLLTLASALLFLSVGLPYWLVVAPISAFLSLVPYIGLPLAMIPPVVAALPISHEPTLYLFLTVSVAVLHLLALNLLYPKFVGARVHLNPIVATISLMFWGMLWGAIGLLLAIPMTAGIKAIIDHVDSLKPYGRLLGD